LNFAIQQKGENMSIRSLSISSLLIENLDSEVDEEFQFKNEDERTTIVVLPKKTNASYDEWVHAWKSVFSSGADVASDWIFYVNVIQDSALHRFHFALFLTCMVSTLSSLLVIFMEYQRLRNPQNNHLFGLEYKYYNAFEIVLEDCPQIILAGWIQMEKKGFTPEGVFNLTVSVNNSFNNFLDLMKPSADGEKRLVAVSEAASSSGHKGRTKISDVELTQASETRQLW
jgi:nitric oxide reductase large subunit